MTDGNWHANVKNNPQYYQDIILQFTPYVISDLHKIDLIEHSLSKTRQGSVIGVKSLSATFLYSLFM